MIEGPNRPPNILSLSNTQGAEITKKVDVVASESLAAIAPPASLSLDPSRVQKKEPFTSAWTFQDLGDFYLCTQSLPDEEIQRLNEEQFSGFTTKFQRGCLLCA